MRQSTGELVAQWRLATARERAKHALPTAQLQKHPRSHHGESRWQSEAWQRAQLLLRATSPALEALLFPPALAFPR